MGWSSVQRLLVHSGSDVSLLVNGERTTDLPNQRRRQLFAEHTPRPGTPLAAYWPRRRDCRVFQIDTSALCPGINSLSITNVSGRYLEIQRVNLGLW